MGEESPPDELRADVLRRLRHAGWHGDANGLEEGRYTPAQVADAFERLTLRATPETRKIAADLRRLDEVEGRCSES